MRKVLTAGSLTIAALLSTGCLMDGGPNDPLVLEEGPGEQMAAPRELGLIQSARGGTLEGTVGPAERLQASATEMSTYDDGYYVTVETVVEQEERAIMTLLSVSNPGTLFDPGTSAHYELNDPTNGGTRVTVLGCVGDEVGIYNQYDKPADEVDIDVTAPESGNPNEVDVTVYARWYERGDQGERLDTFQDAVTQFTLLR